MRIFWGAVFCVITVLILVPNRCAGKNLPQFGSNDCPPNETQCALGCCPHVNGKCCSNGYQCCREGETCIPGTGICISLMSSGDPEDSTTESGWEATPVAFPAISANASAPCPPCTTECGENKCCKFRDGTCCSDGIHCCPYNYACDLEAERCYMTARNEVTNEMLEGKHNLSAVIEMSKATDDWEYEECSLLLKCPKPHTVCCEEPYYLWPMCCWHPFALKNILSEAGANLENDICASG